MSDTPELDKYFPRLGPCHMCGDPGVDQRHRVVDAIIDVVQAGDDPVDVAREYGVTIEAVYAALTWGDDE